MHRFLLYALVLGLLYLAWDARRATMLAAGTARPGPDSAASEAGAPGWDDGRPLRVAPERAHPRNGLQGRLGARIDPSPEGWESRLLARATLLEGMVGLAQAEAWMEANFPEGGAIDREPGSDASSAK